MTTEAVVIQSPLLHAIARVSDASEQLNDTYTAEGHARDAYSEALSFWARFFENEGVADGPLDTDAWDDPDWTADPEFEKQFALLDAPNLVAARRHLIEVRALQDTLIDELTAAKDTLESMMN